MAIISGVIFIYFFFLNKPMKKVCEEGYKLENDSCILPYSFKSIYETKLKNQGVNLFGDYFDFIIDEMIIDGKKVDFCRTYKFESIGLHTVLVSMNLSKKKKSLEYMFSESEMISIAFGEKFNTEEITDMSYMFEECEKLTSIEHSVFNTINVLNMGGMFSGCSSLKSLDLSNFITDNVEDMNNMFSECSSLTSIDLSNFNTEEVTDMNGMFNECRSLTSINLSNFNTKHVTDMFNFFMDANH